MSGLLSCYRVISSNNSSSYEFSSVVDGRTFSLKFFFSNFCPFTIAISVPESQKSHGYAGITREEGLQNEQSVRKVSCQRTTEYILNTDITKN